MMRFSTVSLAALLLVTSAAACDLGDVDGPGDGMMMGTGGGGNGSATFATQISPIIGRCSGCHMTGVPPTLTTYDKLEAKYKMKPGSGNVFVTKGDHSGITYFTPTEADQVKNWIDNLQP